MDFDAYRAAAESFYVERWRAEYRHLAGLDAEYPLEQIYDRHAGLFEREAVLALQERAEASVPGTDEHRRARMLWDFALDGHAELSDLRLEGLASWTAACDLHAEIRPLSKQVWHCFY